MFSSELIEYYDRFLFITKCKTENEILRAVNNILVYIFKEELKEMYEYDGVKIEDKSTDDEIYITIHPLTSDARTEVDRLLTIFFEIFDALKNELGDI